MSQPSVLIIDESAETREVLRTALERGGNRIFEANRVDRGLEMARLYEPDLIVLDMEVHSAGTLAGGLGETAQASHTPIVALGTARHQISALPTGEFVAKPYHFAPLIRKIEELLRRKGPVAVSERP